MVDSSNYILRNILYILINGILRDGNQQTDFSPYAKLLSSVKDKVPKTRVVFVIPVRSTRRTTIKERVVSRKHDEKVARVSGMSGGARERGREWKSVETKEKDGRGDSIPAKVDER